VKGYRAHLLAITLYALLAVVLTWPLVLHITTHIPGSAVWAFDESTFVWNMWWFKFSLLDLGQSPLQTGYIFYPLGIDLVLYTFNFFNALLGLPFQMLLSLTLASNLVILLTYVMSGYGTYLLVLYLLVSGRQRGRGEVDILQYKLAAFVAGAVYAFAASRMIYAALGHYDMVTAYGDGPMVPLLYLILAKGAARAGVSERHRSWRLCRFCPSGRDDLWCIPSLSHSHPALLRTARGQSTPACFLRAI
jgi:hypothetical protein